MMKIRNIVTFFVIVFTLELLTAQIPTAVTEFEVKGISQSEASSLTDRLRSELFKFGTFQIIERGLMEEILSEQGFQQTGCVSDECVVEVGKLIGVQQIIGGSISKVGKIFCGHTKGSKKVVRTGSVKPLLKALNIYMENQK